MSAALQLAAEYELIYILRPTCAPSDAKKVSDRLVEVMDRSGAQLTKVDNWGKRRLAYTIKKHTRGHFIYLKFVSPTGVITELERHLRNLDEVIRFQTVRLEGLHDPSAVQVEPEEIEFRELETSDEVEDEPSFEERLGLRPARREPEPSEERGSREGGDAAPGDAAPGDADTGAEVVDAPADGVTEPAASAERSPASETPSSTEDSA